MMLAHHKKLIAIIVALAVVGFFIYRSTINSNDRSATFNLAGTDIKFVHADDNDGEDLIITSDKETYQGFSGTTVYFSIDPLRKENTNIGMQFYFTDPKAKIVKIYRYNKSDNYWITLPLSNGGIANDKYIQAREKQKEVDGNASLRANTSFDSTGEKEYFMAEIAYSPGTPGQFLIETFGNNGSYGILDPWYSSGWAYRKKISINATPSAGASGLTNFPMLFSRTDLDLRATGSGGHVASTTGGDILFTDENDVKIPHEIETYTSTTGELVAWVKVPYISSTSTRDIYIYYGNSTVPLANQQDIANTWDSNYKGVYHLKDGTTLSVTDSTGNANNGTNNGATATTGKVDGAANFNGSTQDVAVGDTPYDFERTDTFTVESWINPNITRSGSEAGYEIVSKLDSNSPFSGWEYYLDWNNSSAANKAVIAILIDNTFPTNMINVIGGIDILNEWTHVVFTYSGSSAATGVKIYVNGVQDTNNNLVSALSASILNNISTRIGSRNSAAAWFKDKQDEVRISNSVRSADWILTEYNNQISPNTFYSYSGEGLEIRPTTVASVKIRSNTGSVSGWYNSGWLYRKKISINATPSAGASGLTNFPMLFSRTDLELRATTSGGFVASTTGGDILFTDENGVKIPHELEKYTSTTGVIIAWVKVPYISSTSTRDIYIYYGNSTVPLANQQDITNVWDSSFVAVYHLPNGTTLGALDSTANAKNGTISGPTATTGEIDGGAVFSSGSNTHIDTGITTAFGDFTACLWFNSPSVATGYERLLDKKFDTGFWLGRNSSTANSWGGGVIEGSPFGIYITLADASWHYLCSIRSGTTHTINGDGGSVTNSNTVSSSALDTTQLRMGVDNNVSAGTSATMDEVRISSVARSADWIATEYTNQVSPNTFYSYSGQGVQTQSASTSTVKIKGGVKFR